MFPRARALQFTLNNNMLLLLLVALLFSLNYYQRSFFFRPGSIHQWRQCDCLSITKNYYEEGMHFLTPKIHYQGVEDGKAVSECPLLNYSVAAMWQVFGEHEFIYRFLEYMIFIIAIFVLFNTVVRFSESPVLAFLTVLFPLTSPLLAYYAPNFIADVPAFSLAVISYCLFFGFYNNRKPLFFYSALLAGTLAVLMKASALMPLAILYFFSLADITRTRGLLRTAKLFERKLLPVLAVLASAALITAWYRYALWYNSGKNNNIFLLTILPLWEMDETELIYNLKMLFNDLFPQFLSKPMFFLFVCLVIYVISGFRRLPVFLKYSFVACGVFFIAYLVFFFQVFSVHDYYLVNLMIFPVVSLMCFCELITNSRFYTVNFKFGRAFVVLAFVFNGFHCAAMYRLRTIEDDKMAYWFPFISEDENRLAKYRFWDYGNAIRHVEDIRPVLRQAGIKRSDRVLSIPDGSFNISLYFMDQKGFTVAKDHLIHDPIVAQKFINKVSYVVLSDTTLRRTEAFQRIVPRLEHFLSHKAVIVYKVRPASSNAL
jgi:hypothetical protein